MKSSSPTERGLFSCRLLFSLPLACTYFSARNRLAYSNVPNNCGFGTCFSFMKVNKREVGTFYFICEGEKMWRQEKFLNINKMWSMIIRHIRVLTHFCNNIWVKAWGHHGIKPLTFWNRKTEPC